MAVTALNSWKSERAASGDQNKTVRSTSRKPSSIFAAQHQGASALRLGWTSVTAREIASQVVVDRERCADRSPVVDFS
jgi:hypothetical protein